MIIALAGRRIDAMDAAVPRFPLASVERVRADLRRLFEERGARTLVCSAACGADLLALDVAGKLGMRRRVILPSPRDEFRAGSVVDRPGDWGPLYDRVYDEVAAHGDVVILPPTPIAHEGYLKATRTILEVALAQRASQQGPGAAQVLVVVAWEGAPRGEDDLTAAFRALAHERGLPVIEVLTR